MRVLSVGGTGFISSAFSRMAGAQGHEVHVLNRGRRSVELPEAHLITADIHRPDEVRAALHGMEFEAVIDWIAFTRRDIERDLSLFADCTKQYVFISSASTYHKPPADYLITEQTPLDNPYWAYSRGKIACERRLMQAYREDVFPVTIVRPSLTYDTNLPIAIGGWGCYSLADRLLRGAPIIVHGDGTSLWVTTHAQDFARGLLGLLGNEQAIGEAFHITSDEVLTWNQIYETIAEELGVEANIVHIPSDFICRVSPGLTGTLVGDKMWSVVFDNTKIKSFVPGFECVIPLRVGVGKTLEWFAAQESRRRIDQTVNTLMDWILRAYARSSVEEV